MYVPRAVSGLRGGGIVASGGRSAERTATVAKTTKWDRLPYEKKLQVLEGLDRTVDELKKTRKTLEAAKKATA